MDAIQIIGLTKKYKDTVAVDTLSLTVREGELISLLGTNGAGKTTTIKMLSCLTKPDAGDALLMGKSIRTEASAVKEIIASSPQETAIAPGPACVPIVLPIVCIGSFSPKSFVSSGLSSTYFINKASESPV